MNSKFHKMLEKKRDMSPAEKHAKMSVLKDLKHATSEAAGDRLGLKKVSVMSDSDEGLKHGLEKAQDMAGDMSPGMSDGGMADESSTVHDGGLEKDQEFSYSEGGEVDSPDASGIEPDADDADGENDMAEAMDKLDDEDSRHENHSAEEIHGEEGEFQGMDIGAIEEKIKHLMALRQKMGSK